MTRHRCSSLRPLTTARIRGGACEPLKRPAGSLGKECLDAGPNLMLVTGRCGHRSSQGIRLRRFGSHDRSRGATSNEDRNASDIPEPGPSGPAQAVYGAQRWSLCSASFLFNMVVATHGPMSHESSNPQPRAPLVHALIATSSQSDDNNLYKSDINHPLPQDAQLAMHAATLSRASRESRATWTTACHENSKQACATRLNMTESTMDEKQSVNMSGRAAPGDTCDLQTCLVNGLGKYCIQLSGGARLDHEFAISPTQCRGSVVRRQPQQRLPQSSVLSRPRELFASLQLRTAHVRLGRLWRTARCRCGGGGQ